MDNISQYGRLDALILRAIENRRHPLYERDCTAESERLEEGPLAVDLQEIMCAAGQYVRVIPAVFRDPFPVMAERNAMQTALLREVCRG